MKVVFCFIVQLSDLVLLQTHLSNFNQQN